MTDTITAQDGTAAATTPVLVLGYDTTRESRNIVHDTLDGGIAVVMIPPRPRSGELRLFYPAESDARDAAELLARDTSFLLVSTERPTIGMTFVLSGRLRTELDDRTRNAWTVTAGYQEITP